MVYSICSSHQTQAKTVRGELLPVVAKSLIISAFVCALLAVISWGLKPNSNTLTLAFSLGGGSSLFAGLLLLALSKTGKKHIVPHPKHVHENKTQTNNEEAFGKQLSHKLRRKREGKNSEKGVRSNKKDIPETTFQDTNLELDRNSLVDSLDNWISAANQSYHIDDEDYLEAKNIILKNFDKRSVSLDLSFLGIVTLPDALRSCTSLEVLNLNMTQIASLPDWIGQFTALKTIGLFSCPISALPDSLARCTRLVKLYLDNTRIESLPEWILSFSQSLEIELSRCPLNAPFLRRLRAAMANRNYRGPRISFSMERTEGRSSDRSIEDVLKEVCAAAGKEVLVIDSIIEENTSGETDLKSWLNRLGYMADFKKGGEGAKKKGGEGAKRYAELIHGAIELAIKDVDFRSVFFVTISEAGNTCGDRVALSILQLNLKYEIHKCKDPTRLADLVLKGLWTLNFLEVIARNKLLTLSISDPIETYLAYPVKLAKDIGYPLIVPEMLYFRCSGVTEDDLEIAKTLVLERLAPGNYQKQATFLAEQEEWQKIYKTKEILRKKKVFDQITKEIESKKEDLSEEDMKRQGDAQKALKEERLKATMNFLNKNFHQKVT